MAIDVLGEVLGRENIFLLSSAAAMRHDRRDRDVEAWTSAPFGGSVSLEELQRIEDDGAAVRTIDAADVRPGLLVLVQIGVDGRWNASPRPPYAPRAKLVVAEPPARPDPRGSGRAAELENLTPP
jgi:hypothetical protein